MKLKRLIINNFRGLKEDSNVIDFENSEIIFLIGKNNTGKSTFLHAYNFFVTPKQKAIKSDFINHDISKAIEITAEFRIEKTDEVDKALVKDEPDWIKKWVTADNVIRIRKTWSSENSEGVKMTYNPEKGEFVEGGFGGFDTLLKKYAPAAIIINAISTPQDLEAKINEIITKNHLKKLETQYAEQYAELLEKLEELREEISQSEDIHAINDKMNTLFQSVFPDLQLQVYPLPDTGLDITKTLKSSHGVSVSNTRHENDNNSDLKNNGHGVIRQAFFSFLSTLEAVLESKTKEYLILFEEPELFLHPEAIFALRKQLYDLALDSPFQVLCATHSSLMIDTSMPHSSLVRLVKDDTNTTKTYQVHFDAFKGEDKNYLQMINRFNPHICECFYSDEVILVEGDTEAIIYRDLIARYYFTQRDIFVLNTGSKANLTFYQRMLTHFSIKHTVIHDVDSPTYITKDGTQKINGMWTYNEKIWEQIESSNTFEPGISRRFIHNKNFEDAHGYKENKAKGKPLSAFEFAKSLTLESELPCIKFLKDLFTKGEINHSQDYLLELANQITKDNISEVVPTT